MLRPAALLSLMVLGLALSGSARAGKVGDTVARYTLGGAGVGALLGAATATVPYLTSKQPFDFYAGAGVGTLAGAGVGFIFGIIDLVTEVPADQPAAMLPRPERQFFAFNTGATTGLGFQTSF